MIRLSLRLRAEHAELVLAELLDLAPGGVEESQCPDGTIEYAIYGAPGELPALPVLRAAAGGELVEVSTSELPDDWSERWRRFHHAVVIEPPLAQPGLAEELPRLRIRPPWEPPADGTSDGARDGGLQEIVIEPGQAFGTGAHATTRLCLQLLLALAASSRGRAPLLDVGSGSGVIAIAATRLGFDPVLALDHDPHSVAAAQANALANGADVEVQRLDLRTTPLPWLGQAPGVVVVANLLRPLLLSLASSMTRAPAHLIAGGLLSEEADEVASAFAQRLEMRQRARLHSGEWAALWLAGAA